MSQDKLNCLFVWKDHNHFKIKYMKHDKKSKVDCIGRKNVQQKLDELRKAGWSILIGKPDSI